MNRILLIDDEPQIRAFLRIALAAEGYEVVEAASGQQGLVAAACHPPALVILDLGLPDMDGAQVLARLREWSDCPVLILTARDQEQEVVRLLDNGANDYVTKPFGVPALLARLRALLRLRGTVAEPQLSLGPLQFDFAAREVRLHEQTLTLGPKEYSVLSYLARHHGKVVSQRQLLEEIWGPLHADDSHYLRIIIGQLRKKLGDDASAPTLIETLPGVGYRLLAGP